LVIIERRAEGSNSVSKLVAKYLKESGKDLEAIPASWLSYLSSLESVAAVCDDVARSIVRELADQRTNLKLIASENFCSLAVQQAMGNLLSDKYAEGTPAKRFYAGCDNIDQIEDGARRRASKLFGMPHAYVQPHSGADANLVAFLAVLHSRLSSKELSELNLTSLLDLPKENWQSLRDTFHRQRMLAMNLPAGGHLTHGYRLNISSVLFDVDYYGVDPVTGLIDYDALEAQAIEVQPLILLAGYSAYPRAIDFSRMRRIADRVGAVLIVDIAHFAGLVAGGVFTGESNPVGYADIITSTTHKTLRGPRGGLVLCTDEFAQDVDKGCPYILGGPLPHIMAAKAVCFEEAQSPEFATYAHRIVENAQALSSALADGGATVVTGGTDNHMLLIDVRTFGLTGRQAESALRSCGITLNRNMIPGDNNGPWYTSGLRMGTPALTTLGMGPAEMREIGATILEVLRSTNPVATATGNTRVKFEMPEQVRAGAKERMSGLLREHVLYPELDLDFLIGAFGWTEG
jgi:glycine hydroxymethyltransferase